MFLGLDQIASRVGTAVTRIAGPLEVVGVSFALTAAADNARNDSTNNGHIEDNHCEQTDGSSASLIGVISG